MRKYIVYGFFLIGLLLTPSIAAQRNNVKSTVNPDAVLATGWYVINETEGTIERKLIQKDSSYHLMTKPIVLWSDVETMRLVNHEKFNYAAILIALKRDKIEQLKEEKSPSEKTQWGLVVDNELVLVQSIDRQRFSGNFQISAQDSIEWLEELYENLKLIDSK